MNHSLDFWKGNQLFRSMDKFIDDWSGMRSRGGLVDGSFNPSCEVTETKNSYQVRMDIPGVSKDQIKIDLHDGYLTISGERKEERKEEDKKQHFSEMYYGSFSRSLSFPVQVDSERIEAKYENGVLNMSIPKAEASKARQITIK